MTTTVRAWLDNALLQSAAESYLDTIKDFTETDQIQTALKAGANHPELIGKTANDPLLPGATRFTDTQAQWFTANYTIVTHYPNDASGFSATLFKNKTTGEYTLSFRSTEYATQAKGGDWERDGIDGADGDISSKGFALGQLSSMETFYSNLKQGKVYDSTTGTFVVSSDANITAFASGTPTLNVTGYSLGAHMSSAFTLMHSEDVAQTYNYNAAGLGGIGDGTLAGSDAPTDAGITNLVHMYDTLMHYHMGDPVPTEAWWNELVATSPNLGAYLDAVQSTQGQTYANLYANPMHGIVMNLLAPRMYPAGTGGIGLVRALDSAENWAGSTGNGPMGHDTNAFSSVLFQQDAWVSKITQLYGHGEFFDPEMVANGGYHATPQNIWIEDLPTSRHGHSGNGGNLDTRPGRRLWRNPQHHPADRLAYRFGFTPTD